MESVKVTLQKPSRLMRPGQPCLEYPQQLGVLAPCQPIVASHMPRDLLFIAQRSIPPSAFNAMRACEQLQGALIKRARSAHGQAQWLGQDVSGLRNVHRPAGHPRPCALPALPDLPNLPTTHPFGAMVLMQHWSLHALRPKSRSDALIGLRGALPHLSGVWQQRLAPFMQQLHVHRHKFEISDRSL